MVKAEIETGTGTKIWIEGTVEEISAIISLYNKNEIMNELSHSNHDKPMDNCKKNSSKTKSTLVGYILELKNSGFFNTPKKTVLVKKILDQNGHFYPMQSISTCLINRNKKGELGRIKEENEWAYVKR